MNANLIATLVRFVILTLNPKLLRRLSEKALIFVEQFVVGTKSKVDDRFILPICKGIRDAFSLPESKIRSEYVGDMFKLLMSILTPDLLKRFADMVLDYLEDYVAKTPNKFDDRFILPVCKNIRDAFDILEYEKISFLEYEDKDARFSLQEYADKDSKIDPPASVPSDPKNKK
jgi:hypothetical protein